MSVLPSVETTKLYVIEGVDEHDADGHRWERPVPRLATQAEIRAALVSSVPTDEETDPLFWVCWRESRIDPGQICRHDRCGWADVVPRSMASPATDEAARRLRAGQRMRWCEAHHDVVDYGRDDACRIALRINDEVACDIVWVALVRLPAKAEEKP